jgi:uncharacterized protein (TIGR03118 family)
MRNFHYPRVTSSRGSQRRARPYRPSLERLEDRSLPSSGYLQTNLVSDQSGMASHQDTKLLNPWGLSYSSSGAFWVSDNNSGVSTLYDGSGNKQSLTVTIPAAPGGTQGTPTGTVFNTTSGFKIRGTPATFLFDSEDGVITGWNGGTTATIAVDNSSTGAVYKGLALGSDANGPLLYAANFHSGTVDVFNQNFQPASISGNFVDPTLPAGFAPFNVAIFNNFVIVTYAVQDAAKHDPVLGPGNGAIDAFDADGNFKLRLGLHGRLNAPWGMAVAPSNFGTLSGDGLVGNFGDGTINAYSTTTFKFVSNLDDSNGNPIAIDGLWALKFGNGGLAGPTNTLFFSAGPNSEADGLFGSLTSNQSSAAGSGAQGFGIALGTIDAMTGANTHHNQGVDAATAAVDSLFANMLASPAGTFVGGHS